MRTSSHTHEQQEVQQELRESSDVFINTALSPSLVVQNYHVGDVLQTIRDSEFCSPFFRSFEVSSSESCHSQRLLSCVLPLTCRTVLEIRKKFDAKRNI